MASQFFRNSLKTTLNSQWRSSITPFHFHPLFQNPSYSSSIPLINHRFFWTGSSSNPNAAGIRSRWVEMAKAMARGISGNSNQGKPKWRRRFDFWVMCFGIFTTVTTFYGSRVKKSKLRFTGKIGDYSQTLDHLNKLSDKTIEIKKISSVAVVEVMIKGKGIPKLIDHNGKSITKKDFLGHWNLIYLGDTHSPDSCSDELKKLALAIDEIHVKSGIEVVPVFLSVDPERDTAGRVREYVKEFHHKFIGITGAADVIKKTERVTYLMNPKMKFVKFVKIADDASLADEIIQEIKQHSK